MKKLILLLLLAVMLSGCSGVWTNGNYTKLLERTNELAKQSALRAEEHTLTLPQAEAIIIGNANLWQRFVDAAKGKAGAE